MKFIHSIHSSVSLQQRASFLAITFTGVVLVAILSATASANDCSQSTQSQGNCKQTAMPQPLQKTTQPHIKSTPTALPGEDASRHGIIFVGGRGGPNADTRAINSQPVPPGRGDKRAINSQPVPPGHAVHVAPQLGDPVENTDHAQQPAQHQS